MSPTDTPSLPAQVSPPEFALSARRPHAIVRRVNTAKAEALEGVLAVLTSRDVPCNEFGYYSYDQPVLCGPRVT